MSRKSRERSRTVPRERACVTFGVRQKAFSALGKPWRTVCMSNGTEP